MKTNYKIQLLILMISCCALSQNRATQFIDSCKIILNNNILQFNKAHSEIELRLNDDDSYIKLDFQNENIKSKRLKFSELQYYEELVDKKVSTFTCNFVYEFLFNGFVIHKFNLKCDSDISKELKYYKSIVKCLKKGKLIGPERATEIAKQNGFNKIYSYDLDDDPRWRGPNYYEENEKKWRKTWTIKIQNISNGNNIGYEVIKIDAKNGKVLCKYLEFTID